MMITCEAFPVLERQSKEESSIGSMMLPASITFVMAPKKTAFVLKRYIHFDFGKFW